MLARARCDVATLRSRALFRHRKATLATNLLGRLFGEELRRSKMIPHAFGERAVMQLMFAALLSVGILARHSDH